MNTSDPCDLNLDCRPGDLVRWTATDGKEHEGLLRSWDNLTAIIEEDGDIIAVSA